MNTLQCEQVIKGLPPVLDDTVSVSLDLELSGLKEGQLHRPFGKLVSLSACFDGKTAYIIFDSDEVQEFLNRIEKATWIFHNSTFDLGHLRRWATVPERRNMRDTLLIERLMWSNYYDDFTLADLVRRYLKCYMEKDTRKEFIEFDGVMTPDQINYAALDVIGTWLVDQEQQKIISDNDKIIWDNLYNHHVWAVLEFGGFKLDVDKWTDLAEKNQRIIDEIAERLGNKYGIEVEKVKYGKRLPKQSSKMSDDVFDMKMSEYLQSKVVTKEFIPFNPASSVQVLTILKSQGLPVESTGDDEIRPYYDSNEFVKDILDYRKSAKQVTTYGLSFLKNVEADERIYTSLNISKAETGRDSSSSPNLQNIPATKERRECFIAGAGKKLGIWDYSGQEANLFAFITGDPILKEIINSGKKLYLEVARLAFNEIVEKDTPRYKIIKALVLGLMYGLTPHGFARDNNVSSEVAEEMFNAFFTAFPVAASWVKDQQARNKGVTKTIIGRICHLHPYDWQWKNNSLNNPMQGSGSDMIKIAIKKIRATDFYKTYYPQGKVRILLQVHDEIVLEFAEGVAEEGGNIVRPLMIETAETMHPGIRGNVSGGIVDNWSEK